MSSSNKTGFRQGRLGIGKEPIFPLDISGSMRIDGDLVLAGTIADAQGNPIEFGASSATFNMDKTFPDPTIAITEFPDWSGNVVVEGAGKFEDIVSKNGDIFYNGGNVGIGTNSPGYKLEVTGNINASGNISGHTVSAQNYAVGSVNFISASRQGNFRDLEVKNSSNTETILLTGDGGNISINGTLSADTISEKTSASGVTIDSVLLKDNNVTAHTISAQNYAVGGTNFISASRQGNFRDLEVKNSSNNHTILLTGDSGDITIDGTLSATTLTGNLAWSYITSQPTTISTTQASNITTNNAKVSSQWTTTSSSKIYYNGGNVGIGTDSPDNLLHLKGSYPLKIESSTNSSYYTLFDYNQISSYGDKLHINHANSNNVGIACGGGNVGIGTDSPDSKLHVMTSTALDGIRLIFSHATSAGVTIGGHGMTTIDGNSLQLGCNNTAYMYVKSTGEVQIDGGTGSKLKVANIHGSTGLGYHASGYGKHNWYGTSHWAGNSSASSGSYGSMNNWDAYGSHDFIYLGKIHGALISTGGFIHLSDERIKRDIEDLPDNESLNKVLEIEVRKYGYQDYINKGTYRVTGFIAQEVLKVFPEAVSTNTDGVLPNIYKITTGHNYDISENKLILDVSGISLTEDIKIDSKIQLKLLNHETLFEEDIDVYLKEVNDTNIVLEYKKEIDEQNEENLKVLKNKIEKTQEIFIFGSYVDNIHTVNKNKIFILHHGAIQQLHKEQQADKAKIAELETKVATLESTLETVLARLTELENK
ncbi:MAG: hypothetical protein CML42_06690 [Rhodobacteraceae bacterium]|nr:hypothetical protein [Paracoccaceae bacterium]|tara:strand:- start:9615 stop:11903 length:2289 start_codon:yes stop_codon:yes gene_type:complete